MSKPKFDLAAGEYRVLSGPGQGGTFGPQHPQAPAEISQPPAVEWYRRKFAKRSKIVTRIQGRKRPKIVTEQEDLELTVGLALGGAGLLLAWEVGTSIAHGLSGANPLSWAEDVDNWLTGKKPAPPSTTGTIGGRLQASILAFLDGVPGPTASSSSSSSSGSSSSQQLKVNPNFFDFPIE